MRNVRRLVAALAVVLLLSGCSPAIEFAVRLNADDTVDYYVCRDWTDIGRVRVDYEVGREDGPTEWVADSSGQADPDFAAVIYGQAPEGFKTTVLADPPPQWDRVRFGFGNMRRDQLEVGHWVWNPSYPWVPAKPCEGADLP